MKKFKSNNILSFQNFFAQKRRFFKNQSFILIVKDKKKEGEEMPRKDLLMAFANLMASKLSHEEIDMFCTAMLHANMICKLKRGD